MDNDAPPGRSTALAPLDPGDAPERTPFSTPLAYALELHTAAGLNVTAHTRGLLDALDAGLRDHPDWPSVQIDNLDHEKRGIADEVLHEDTLLMLRKGTAGNFPHDDARRFSNDLVETLFWDFTAHNVAAALVRERSGKAFVHILPNDASVLGRLARGVKTRLDIDMVFFPEALLLAGAGGAFQPKGRVLFLGFNDVTLYGGPSGTLLHELRHGVIAHQPAERTPFRCVLESFGGMMDNPVRLYESRIGLDELDAYLLSLRFAASQMVTELKTTGERASRLSNHIGATLNAAVEIAWTCADALAAAENVAPTFTSGEAGTVATASVDRGNRSFVRIELPGEIENEAEYRKQYGWGRRASQQAQALFALAHHVFSTLPDEPLAAIAYLEALRQMLVAPTVFRDEHAALVETEALYAQYNAALMRVAGAGESSLDE